jgi:hypothetical protein
MALLEGLASTKTEVELVRAIRDAAARGELKQDEFAGRIAEIYDYIINAKGSERPQQAHH